MYLTMYMLLKKHVPTARAAAICRDGGGWRRRPVRARAGDARRSAGLARGTRARSRRAARVRRAPHALPRRRAPVTSLLITNNNYLYKHTT